MRIILAYALLGLCAWSITAHGQDGVVIGGTAPDPQAILDIQSTTKGVLIPRMTTAQRDAIGVTFTDYGMMIYNIDDSEFNYWDGGAWLSFPSAGGGSDADWHIGLGSTPPTNINDNIWTNGNVGLGFNNPVYRLDVNGDARINGNNIWSGPVGTGSFYIRSSFGVSIELNDFGGSTTGYFRIKSNADQNLFRVDNDGLTTIDGDVIITDGGNILTFLDEPDANIVVDHTSSGSANLDIEADSDIDIVIDRDNDNTSTEFAIKRNSDGAAAVNKLFTVQEDNSPLVYPYGTNTGETGGIRFRELEANGSNYIGLRAPDVLGSNYNLTLPTTDGTNGYLLQTDGTGILSWVDPSGIGGGDADWLVEGSGSSPSSSTDNIYTEGEVGIGTTTPGYDLEVVGDVKFEGDFINQEILGAHSGTVQNVPFTNLAFNPLTGTNVSITIEDGSGANHSGVLITGFARVFGGSLVGNNSSSGGYFLVLERDTDPGFGTAVIMTYTGGNCYIETPNGASSAVLPLHSGAHVSYVDNNLTAGITYYYRLTLVPSHTGITSGTYDVYQRDLNVVQIKR